MTDIIFYKLFPSRRPQLNKFEGRVIDASGKQVPILGTVNTQVHTPKGTFTTTILVYNESKEVGYDLLLGMNILQHTIIDFNTLTISFLRNKQNNTNKVNNNNNVHMQLKLNDDKIHGIPQRTQCSTMYNKKPQAEQKNSTLQSARMLQSKVSHSELHQTVIKNSLGSEAQASKAKVGEPKASQMKAPGSCKQIEAGSGKEINEQMDNMHGINELIYNKNKNTNTRVNECKYDETFGVYLTQDVHVKANTMKATPIRVNKQITNNKCIILHKNELKTNVFLPNIVTNVINNKILIELVNLSPSDHVFKAGSLLCNANYYTNKECLNEIQSSVEDKQYVNKCSNQNKKANVCTEKNNVNNNVNKVNNYRPLTSEDINCGNYEMEVLELLNKYRDATWLPGEKIGHYTGEQLRITLKDDVIIKKQQYRFPHAYQEPLDKIIKDMLDEGIIRRSRSSYNSPIIIVKKPDKSIRVCIDLREINKHIKPVSFPLPRVDDLLNSLGQSPYLTVVDVVSAFYHLDIHPDDREKTAFTVRNTKYEFIKVPFGLTK